MHIRLTHRTAARRACAVLAAGVLVATGLNSGSPASGASPGGLAAAGSSNAAAQAAAPPPGLPGVPDNAAFKENLRVTLYRSYLPSSGSQNQISAQLPKVSLKNTTTGVVTPLPT